VQLSLTESCVSLDAFAGNALVREADFSLAANKYLTTFKISLDEKSVQAHNLTMVKIGSTTTKGEQTRELIFKTALELFRESGFDATTMQEVADRAGVAKGAAYYYFPSKEAIIQAYYEAVQSEQERLCNEAFAKTNELKKRLHVAMHSKFDLAQHDRNLLGIVFRYTGEPAHPLSCLGQGTVAIRRRATEVFHQALSVERLPKDLEQLLPLALWALQMGLLVMFLYDDSADQKRTRQLATGSIDFTLKVMVLAKLPILKPIRTKVLTLLREASLLPETRAFFAKV
jgi:AcrR family transcriptional regulator